LLVHAKYIYFYNHYDDKNTINNANMCQDTIRLCVSCADTFEKWNPCEEFDTFKMELKNDDLEPNVDEWVSQHAIPDLTKMQITIMVVTCPGCTKLKKPKMKTESLVESVEKITIPLAGTFELMNGKSKKIMRKWEKKIYQPISEDVVTDAETENDTENETDNDNE
jgi:hypothetical protein